MSKARPATPADAAETYRLVVDALQRWEMEPGGGFITERQLASHLADVLNEDGAGARRHEVRVTRAGAADVAIDGTVAVLLFRDFSASTISSFSRIVSDVASTYDYLVVLGYDLAHRDLDRWRMGKARYTASRTDLEAVTYLSHSRDESAPSSRWPSALWYYAEPLVALLAIVIGIEIAILLQLQTGGLAPFMGPAATLGTVLVLMVLLVLVYERTEV